MESKILITRLYEINAVKFGEFKLKSGMLSPIYIDLRVIVSYPDVLIAIADAFASKIKSASIEYDLLAGIPYTALPIASVLAIKEGKPMIYCRKEVKDYGTKKKIEGVYMVGQTCLIIDDLITTGDSKFETIAPFESEGLIVKDIIVLVDREQGGGEKLKQKGYKFYAILTISDILAQLEASGKLQPALVQKVKNFLASHQV